MEEFTWKFVQIGMWIIGGEIAIFGFFFLFICKKIETLSATMENKFGQFSTKMDNMYGELNAKIDRNEAKFSARLDTKIDPLKDSISDLDKRLNEIDKRLYGIESVLYMKECCVLSQDQNVKKVQ